MAFLTAPILEASEFAIPALSMQPSPRNSFTSVIRLSGVTMMVKVTELVPALFKLSTESTENVREPSGMGRRGISRLGRGNWVAAGGPVDPSGGGVGEFAVEAVPA